MPALGLSDLANLFGFQGLDIQAIKEKFTKVTPGQELTPAQLATNQNVSTYATAWYRWQDGVKKAELDAAEALEQAAKTVAVAAPAGLVLDGGPQTVGQAARAITETSAMTLQDIGQSQLVVQREILSVLKARMGAGPSAETPMVSGGGATGSSDRDLGVRTTTSTMLVSGVLA